MTYQVLIERDPRGYRATPLSLPDASVTSSTREGVLRAVAEVLTSRLAEAEIVPVEVPIPPRGLLAAVAGLFADDPDLAREICAAAYAARDTEETETA